MTDLTMCKNCGVAYPGNYCNNCGEKRFTQHDRSFLHLLEEGFHFITHFDGTLVRTIRTMIKSPGQMSADYCIGIRKKYFKPLSFFLLLIVLYLVFPFFRGLNMELSYYSKNSFYGTYAAKKIIQMQHGYPDQATLAAAFHHKTEKIAKFLLFILIPMMAAASFFMVLLKKRFYYDHFIFSTELLSFYTLWGFLLFPGIVYILVLLNPDFYMEDWVTGAVIYTGLAIYASVASRRFFSLRRRQSILYGISYTAVLYFAVQMIYKFILFNLTMWQL